MGTITSTKTLNGQQAAKRIKILLKTMTYEEAAKTLNRDGNRTRNGNRFTKSTVNYIVTAYLNG